MKHFSLFNHGKSITQLLISDKTTTTATTITPILMLLSQLAGVSNVSSTSLSPFFLSYVSSLLKPDHSKSSFLCRLFFLFPVISTSMTPHIWDLISPCMTRPKHHRWLGIIMSSIFTTTPTPS